MSEPVPMIPEDPAEFHVLHRDIYLKWVQKPSQYAEYLSALERHYFSLSGKQVDMGTGAAGGFAQPEQLRAEAALIADEVNLARILCGATPVESGNYRGALIDDGTGAAWAGETDARSEETTGAFRSQPMPSGELYAYPKITEWALDDMVDSDAWLLRAIESKFAFSEVAAWINGTGVNQPQGMLANAPNTDSDAARDPETYQEIAIGALNSITAETLGQLQGSLPDEFLAAPQNCAWLMHPGVWRDVRELDPASRAPTRNGAIATFMDMNVFITSQLPIPAAGTNSIAVGNFQQGYMLTERWPGTRITRNDVTDVGKVGIYARRRVGGNVWNNRAIRFGALS